MNHSREYSTTFSYSVNQETGRAYIRLEQNGIEISLEASSYDSDSGCWIRRGWPGQLSRHLRRKLPSTYIAGRPVTYRFGSHRLAFSLQSAASWFVFLSEYDQAIDAIGQADSTMISRVCI